MPSDTEVAEEEQGQKEVVRAKMEDVETEAGEKKAGSGSRKRRIFVISMFSTMSDALPLIPHFVKHYKSLGVQSEDFLITLHMPKKTDEAIEMKRWLKNAGVVNLRVTEEKYSSVLNFKSYLSWWRASSPVDIQHDDWVIPVDMDELQGYPDSSVVSFIEGVHRHGFTHVDGLFVDRLAEDGSFPAIKQDSTLFEQYPMECQLWRISNALYYKVAAHRGDLRAARGHHHMGKSSVRLTSPEVMIPVYHFKWSNNVVGLLRSRIERYVAMGIPWVTESLDLYTFFAHHGGKMPMDRPEEVPCRRGFVPNGSNSEDVLKDYNFIKTYGAPPEDPVPNRTFRRGEPAPAALKLQASNVLALDFYAR